MGSMFRRFVHLIVHEAGGGYTLRKMDTKPLFAGIGGDNTSMRSSRRLPRPAAIFESTNKYDNDTDFFLLGSKIVSVNMNRHTLLYDTLTSAITSGPQLRRSKFVQPAWAAVGGKLYLANTFPDDYGTPCFEALRFDEGLEDLLWDLLPWPHFFNEPYRSDNAIQCYAAGDEGKIWISTFGKGTYTYDVTNTTWSKEGDWTLPFDDRVQYIPEFGLYFGFSKRGSKLCSANLVVGAKASEPPVHQHVWGDIDGYKGKGWHLNGSYLTHLGDSKFCVTRIYYTMRDRDDDRYPLSNIAVISALEARVDPSTGDMQMIRGASRRYKFSSETVYSWAL